VAHWCGPSAGPVPQSAGRPVHPQAVVQCFPGSVAPGSGPSAGPGASSAQSSAGSSSSPSLLRAAFRITSAGLAQVGRWWPQAPRSSPVRPCLARVDIRRCVSVASPSAMADSPSSSPSSSPSLSHGNRAQCRAQLVPGESASPSSAQCFSSARRTWLEVRSSQTLLPGAGPRCSPSLASESLADPRFLSWPEARYSSGQSWSPECWTSAAPAPAQAQDRSSPQLVPVLLVRTDSSLVLVPGPSHNSEPGSLR
jgi:hypothetical protein